MAGIDFHTFLYRPLFATYGVPAVLALKAGKFTATALDKTEGLVLSQNPLKIETLGPVAEFIVADLLDLGISCDDDLDDNIVTLNGKTWKIIAHRMSPTQSGEADGTVYCILEGFQG